MTNLGATKVECPNCGEEEWVINNGATCAQCKHAVDAPDDAADEYLSRVVRISQYEYGKEGEQWPRYFCPECDQPSLIDRGDSGEQNPATRYICFNCGELWNEDASIKLEAP